MGRGDIQFPTVHVSTVDDVTVFWAPMEGPLTAVLQFDGGMFSEAPSQRGIQHLIEHLVLTNVGPRAFDYNGYVDMRRVAFSVRGEPDELREFFSIVAAGVASIPEQRSGHESGVLEAEASHNSGSTLASLLSYMFGAVGPGAMALPELALGAVTPQDMREWAEAKMTTERATMFCSGDPSFLDLSALPRGERGQLWRLPPTIDGPGWAPGNASGFAAVAPLPRTTANATMIRILRDHCLDHVRHRQGVSYGVQTIYEPVTPDDALVGLFVDAAPERRVVARNTLFDALDEFADSGPQQQWLDLDRDRLIRALREHGAGVGRAASAAADFGLGRADPLSESWVEEYDALAPGDLAASAAEFLSAASWQTPPEAPMPPWRGLRRLRLFSEQAVSGRDVAPRGKRDYRLVAGTDGLSIVAGPDRIATVRFDEVVATEAWGDGTRIIYGRDSTRIRFAATEWAEDEPFLTWLDGNLARAPMLRRGTRPHQ